MAGLSLALGGCGGPMSSLAPAGPMAADIAAVWWAMFFGACAILALVMALALYTVLRRPARAEFDGGKLIVAGGVLLPLVSLSALLLYGFNLGAERADARVDTALRIEVVGHRWWWEVRYEDPNDADAPIVTANEIHIPASVPVEFVVSSVDVIHSFWVPRLGGKIDMIPGRSNRVRLQADEPGLFRGQCAEFCGAQHARMAFFVRAHEPDEFEQWLAAQRGDARQPDTELAARGRQEFFSRACIDCHTIRGTRADGRIGPDLTRLGSRMTIAAGTLEMNSDNIQSWIAHNQQIKPGNRMLPFEHLDEETLRALAAYLEALE